MLELLGVEVSGLHPVLHGSHSDAGLPLLRCPRHQSSPLLSRCATQEGSFCSSLRRALCERTCGG